MTKGGWWWSRRTGALFNSTSWANWATETIRVCTSACAANKSVSPAIK